MAARQLVVLSDKVEKLSQVNWYDVGVHAALQYTDLEDIVSKKSATLPIWQHFVF